MFIDDIEARKVYDYAKWEIYFDKVTGWFCFGNPNIQNSGYNFATNTIAVLSNGDLVAIYVKPIFMPA